MRNYPRRLPSLSLNKICLIDAVDSAFTLLSSRLGIFMERHGDHYVKTLSHPQNRKCITYCRLQKRSEPRPQAIYTKVGEVRQYGFRDMWADRYTRVNTSQASRGRNTKGSRWKRHNYFPNSQPFPPTRRTDLVFATLLDTALPVTDYQPTETYRHLSDRTVKYSC